MSKAKSWATQVAKVKSSYKTTHEQLMRDCNVLTEPRYFFMVIDR
jgi:hypothetical protein